MKQEGTNAQQNAPCDDTESCITENVTLSPNVNPLDSRPLSPKVSHLDSRRRWWRKTTEKHGKRDRGAGAGGSAARVGGGDPRDVEVRAFRMQLADLQRKTTAKVAERPEANVDSASSSESEQPECTATIAEMAKMLTDLESKMSPSHSASILLRTEWGARGWAVVQLDYNEEMEPLCGIYGSTEAELEIQRTITRAELTAFVCLLKRVIWTRQGAC